MQTNKVLPTWISSWSEAGEVPVPAELILIAVRDYGTSDMHYY